jgi:MerR family transcriptional regulator/heat shock protein HspR
MKDNEPAKELGDETPVYVISVAAELAGMHPQTLRQYDRLGLVSPGRSSGRGRRYSLRDIVLLRTIAKLTHDGINLAGIARIMELEAIVARLDDEVSRLRQEVNALLAENPPKSLVIYRPENQ